MSPGNFFPLFKFNAFAKVMENGELYCDVLYACSIFRLCAFEKALNLGEKSFFFRDKNQTKSF